MIVQIPAKKGEHPSRFQWIQGVLLQDICQPIEGSPRDYLLNFDSEQEAHRQQYNGSLARGEIDILGLSPEVLAHLEPAFKSESTQRIFRELQQATKEKTQALSDLEKAQQAVAASLEIEKSNLDPSKVDENRKTLRERRETLEDRQVKADTYDRLLADLWEKFFQSLKDYQAAQAEKVREEILPDVEEFNSLIRKAYRLIQNKVAPKIGRLHQIKPEIPGEIYFTNIHLTDLQVRQLKTLEAFAQIRIKPDRFDFSLETLPYGKK